MQKRLAEGCLALFVLTSSCKTVDRQDRQISAEKNTGPQIEVSSESDDYLSLPAWTRINPPQQDVIVQLFNYPFRTITEEMPKLAALGYGQIHVSPPNLTIDSDQWWGRYQPVDYRLIDGPLGNEGEFKAMLKAAHANNIKIIVDLVLNHTYNTSSPLPKAAAELNKKQGPLFTEADYHKNECIGNYDDAWEVRNKRLCGGGGDTGLPDLDQNSPNVLKVQQEFIQRLIAMGVDGFRLDAVKHMEPDYFLKVLPEDIRKKHFVFGEIIADEGTFDRDLVPYLSADPMSLYDFPLRKTLQDVLGPNGDMRTLTSNLVASKRALEWNRSVSFIMNHDIPNNEGFRAWILDPKDEELAYAFILGRSEGVPYVYSDLGTRGGGGLIDDRWDHAHRNVRTATMVRFHNYVHGTSMKVIAADECLLAIQRETKGLVAINKCGIDKTFSVSSANFAKGTVLTSLDTGDDLKVDDKEIPIKVLARSSLTLVTGAKKAR